MKNQAITLVGAVLIGLAILATANSLRFQEAIAAGSATMADQAVLSQAATPTADEAEMVGKMERMMDQCLAMMEMMGGMMGGDISSMMGGEGMAGMEDMPQAAATPEP